MTKENEFKLLERILKKETIIKIELDNKEIYILRIKYNKIEINLEAFGNEMMLNQKSSNNVVIQSKESMIKESKL